MTKFFVEYEEMFGKCETWGLIIEANTPDEARDKFYETYADDLYEVYSVQEEAKR